MYQIKSRVRYSETDVDAKLSITGILNYLQDCSTFQSEDMGVGIQYLAEHRKAWLLASWQIQVVRRPALGENIIVSTWPYGFRGIYGLRNFSIQDESGAYLVKADSFWFLLDTDTGKPLRVTEEDVKPYGNTEPRLAMPDAPRKITVPDDAKEVGRIRVMKHQIDTNHHVNNAQYVDMAREGVPEKIEIGEIRAEYKKAAVLGDTIVLWRAGTEDGYALSLKAEDGSVYANVELKRRIEGGDET